MAIGFLINPVRVSPEGKAKGWVIVSRYKFSAVKIFYMISMIMLLIVTSSSKTADMDRHFVLQISMLVKFCWL